MKKRFLSPEFQNHLWIITSMGVFTLVSTLILLITTRLVDLETAGIVAYATAVANLLVTFILYNANYLQVIDIQEEFSFRNYLGLRTITAALTCLGLFIFLLVSGYNQTTVLIIVFFFFIYLVDAYGNVFVSDFHQKGLLRYGARAKALASFAAIVVFTVLMFIRPDVVSSLAFTGAAVLIIYVAWIWKYREHFGAIRVKMDIPVIKQLAIRVFPMFVTIVVTAFLINSPKYYLEAFVSTESVALYAILYLPAALFHMLIHTLLFGAPLPVTSQVYASGDYKKFLKRIHLQFLFLMAAALPFLAFTYFCGPWLLSLFYGFDIYPYRELLMIISAGGVLFTLTPVFGMALIIMKKQKIYMYSFSIPGIILGAIMLFLVRQSGMIMAVYSCLIMFAPLTIIVYIVFRRALRREMLSSCG